MSCKKQRDWQGLHCKYLQMFPLLAVLPPVLLVFLMPPAASFCLPCHWWADCPPHNISSLIGLYESHNLLFLYTVQPVVPAMYSSFDYAGNKLCSVCCHILEDCNLYWFMSVVSEQWYDWGGSIHSFTTHYSVSLFKDIIELVEKGRLNSATAGR